MPFESTPEQIDAAVAEAVAAAPAWAATNASTRARLLRGLADALQAQRETLVPLADKETALGAVRLNGELKTVSWSSSWSISSRAVRPTRSRTIPRSPVRRLPVARA